MRDKNFERPFEELCCSERRDRYCSYGKSGEIVEKGAKMEVKKNEKF